MQFLRRTGLYAATLMLISTLLLFGLLFGVERVLGTSSSLKQALRGSGTYQTVISDALDQAEEKQQQDSENIPVDRPEIRTIINETFPPEFLQTQTERTLDSAYAWLRGTTPELAFTLDLSEAKIKLADGLSSYASRQITSLPPCAKGQVPNAGDFDAFTATCVPPGLDANAVAAEVRQEILGGEFIKDTQITADTLKTDSGERFDQAYRNAPQVFQKAKAAVYGFAVLALLVGAGAVFLCQTRRGGFRLVSIVAIGVGAVTVLCGWSLTALMQRAEQDFAASSHGTEPLQQTGIEIIKILVNNVHNWWIGFGALLVLLGIGGLVALHLTKPKQSEPTSTSPNPPDQPSGHKTAPKNSVAKPKPNKKDT